MKIAVPVNHLEEVDAHFGHCEFYSVYSISENGDILTKEKVDSPQGCGCKSNIAGVLAEKGVTIMLAGGIGMGAVNVLGNAGISVVRGCEGGADLLVRKYVEGELIDSGSNCNHHDGEHTCNH